MIQCQNCGKSNAPESHFCRFCGFRFTLKQPENYDFRPPRPYAWKTDEFQTQSEARLPKTTTAHIGIPQQTYGLMTTYHGPQDLSGNYRCPHCRTNYLPILERRISTAGWITFALLLVFTFIFFWIGLLMKEDVPICPVCKRRVN